MKRLRLLASFKRFFSFFILILLVFLLPKNIYAKDYSIELAKIKVEILENGSAEVTEERTYSFSGSFSWADEWINLKAKCDENKFCENYKISNFSLSENNLDYLNSKEGTEGTYTLNITNEKFYVKWFYRAQDQKKTFKLKYTIDNAVANHSDISEFYWQLVGDKWTKSTSLVTSQVFLPYEVPADQIWGYGHGPLNGKVSIDKKKEII